MQQIQALDFSGAFCFPPTTDATVSSRMRVGVGVMRDLGAAARLGCPARL
jgi:hypothetical protein